MQQKLLLFDIDGTLITSGGAGVQALQMSLFDGFGIEDDFSHMQIPGATDSGIARNILAHHALPVSPENIARFLEGYLQHLPGLLKEKTGRVLPGIRLLLEELRTRQHVVLALLTGNLIQGAQIKLEHYDLWHFFEFGAFADDHADRDQLGPFAITRAFERHGVAFAPADIFVIGDTPRDVACGKAIQAATVAIATGEFTFEQLAAAQPDFVFHDFSDVSRVIEQLGW